MATFITNLWESIFVPGPTPTLLVATNAAFGCLQALLLILLIATYSVHFLVLSFLCAGLWWSINWFSAEIKREEIRRKREEEKKKVKENLVKDGDGGTEGDNEGGDSETETESVGGAGGETRSSRGGEGGNLKASGEMLPPPSPLADMTNPPSQGAISTGAGLKPADMEAAHRRRRSLGESSGYVSTDSEWEKVGDDKDR